MIWVFNEIFQELVGEKASSVTPGATAAKTESGRGELSPG